MASRSIGLPGEDVGQPAVLTGAANGLVAIPGSEPAQFPTPFPDPIEPQAAGVVFPPPTCGIGAVQLPGNECVGPDVPCVIPEGPKGDDGDPGPPGTTEAVKFYRVAGNNLSGQRAVTELDDGSVVYAEPDTIGNQPVWITDQAADVGDSVRLVAFGEMAEGSWSWVPGYVYLGVNGVLTQTPPTTGALVAIGAATAPTRLFVSREQTIDL